MGNFVCWNWYKPLGVGKHGTELAQIEGGASCSILPPTHRYRSMHVCMCAHKPTHCILVTAGQPHTFTEHHLDKVNTNTYRHTHTHTHTHTPHTHSHTHTHTHTHTTHTHTHTPHTHSHTQRHTFEEDIQMFINC